MPLTDLNAAELDVLKECLQQPLMDTVLSELEFRTLFGLERAEVRKVLQSCPELNEADDTVAIAINNSFNNLLGYPVPNKKELWPKFLSAKGVRSPESLTSGKPGHEIAPNQATISTTCRKPPGPTGVCACPTANSSSA
jgi:hypothetical protein